MENSSPIPWPLYYTGRRCSAADTVQLAHPSPSCLLSPCPIEQIIKAPFLRLISFPFFSPLLWLTVTPQLDAIIGTIMVLLPIPYHWCHLGCYHYYTLLLQSGPPTNLPFCSPSLPRSALAIAPFLGSCRLRWFEGRAGGKEKLGSCAASPLLFLCLRPFLEGWGAEMGFFSTVLGFFGFGIGVTLGLVIGYYLFIYFQPTDVKVRSASFPLLFWLELSQKEVDLGILGLLFEIVMSVEDAGIRRGCVFFSD
jgi:hypothetical protein